MTIHDEEKRHFTDCSEEEIEIRSWLVPTESDALSASVDAPTCSLSLSLPLSRRECLRTAQFHRPIAGTPRPLRHYVINIW
jgi:hypothetical protein